MNLLINELEKNEKFKQYVYDIENNVSPINLSGLSDVGKMYVTAGIINRTEKPICIITYNEIQARKLIKDLQFFIGKNSDAEIVYFPRKEISPYDYVSQSNELLHLRIDALNKIYKKQARVVVVTIEALMQKMPLKNFLYKNIISFEIGKVYQTLNNEEYKKGDLEELKKVLIELGYERTEIVEAKGQFCIRGGIVDIGLSEKDGVRIEFWGDEVDSIRYFNLSSQRSNEMVNQITIYPAHEYIVNKYINVENDIENTEVGIIPIYSKNIDGICNKILEKYITDDENKNVKSDIEQIKNGDYISKIDKYFNEFYEKQESLLEYLTDDYLICFDEIGKIEQRRQNIIIENNNLIKSLIEKKRIVPEAILNISDEDSKVFDNIKHNVVYLQTNNSYANINKYEFNDREIHVHKSEMDILVKDINKWIKEQKKVILLVGNDDNVEKIRNILREKQIQADVYNNDQINNSKCIIYNPKDSLLNVTSTGFENYDLKLVVINLLDTFENEVKKKKVSNAFKEGEKVVYADLKQGDIVVHRSHGIGQFIGVNTITADNITKDYIKIKYQNDDILYVPTNSLDNVRKYIGAGDNTSPKLHKLGGKEWEKTKNRVKSNLRLVAKDLIELYARREKMQGYAFSEDTEWQKQFEDEFPYKETSDQLRCIDEVKKDMEKQRPMDRLLCGDVGYGKTEVAIRAAFKAVMEHKQVAYLAPTTILASQQYEEFKRRMEPYAVQVELLNRFRTKKEQDNTIRRLKLGEADIVVGTHRILSEDIEFKDLGLLIIDEEHRFGVKAKEKIKKIKNTVDVLTMTATPIPRTLHMSIVGIRDMSVIYEPPQNRRPVQTYVLEHDEEVVKEAITKELERGGQVFYLYNKVETIEKKADEIRNLVPESKVEFAHGKMTGRELEDIMQQFVNKEINVLVCTTILESGIDIPNANTIIVENADRLGLAQLYQIRGRVGRSDKQAYAYIMYKRDKLLTEVAEKRLRAIKEFTEFGSGFKIAMRDLEIRGAGSLLGEMQHGHMEQVGYDMYCKLLDEVVNEMKGIKLQEEKDIQIDINISSYIPDNYIDNSSQKIEVYQNIALCKNEEDIQNVIDEVIDRYGIMPEELENLLEVARIKQLARNANILKVSQRTQSIIFYIDKNKYNPQIIDRLIKKYEFNVKFSNGIEPYITLKNNSNKELVQEIKEFLMFITEKEIKSESNFE